jgi:hypothetical protein
MKMRAVQFDGRLAVPTTAIPAKSAAPKRIEILV